MKFQISNFRFQILIGTAALLIGSNAFGQNVFVANDSTHPVPVTGGGGGAATIADGADISEGPTDAAVVAAGAAGSVQSKLRRLTADIDAIKTSVANIPSPTATTVVSTALEASHVLKASAGTLVRLDIYNSKTTSQYILVMNSTTVPADGAVTLLLPPIPIPANGYVSQQFEKPITASTGIAVSNSSTGTFTKTIGSADCVFTAQVQ